MARKGQVTNDSSKDWERKATDIPGIFLFKLPGANPWLAINRISSLDMCFEFS
jgi:hypothetical protein